MGDLPYKKGQEENEIAKQGCPAGVGVREKVEEREMGEENGCLQILQYSISILK